MNSRLLFIILVLIIVISLLGSIVLFSYLGISFQSDSVTVLKRAAVVTTDKVERGTISIN